ncbi:MAG: hypothetical protein WCC04_09630 [Terriglobales bacterium]
MRRILPILCGMMLAAFAAAQSDLGAGDLGATGQQADTTPTTTTPTIKGVLDSSRTAVFVTPRQSCNSNDIPDAMARAFRDNKGMIHLVAASSELFQSIGPTLESVQHSCEIGHRSAGDPNPADFNDQTWIDTFYTFDRNTIAGLTHTEYHGWARKKDCTFKNGDNGCEYDSDTYHESNDGGYHFYPFKPPANFLAGIPYQYVKDGGPSGYSVDSNIIELGGWYYAMVTSYAWPPGCSGTTGPNRCLTPGGGGPMRTQDVFDPSSWRGWNGKDFSVSFVDPYPGPVDHPEAHVYAPVPYMDVVTAINLFESSNVVVATLWNPWDNEYGVKGLYLSTSTDLVNWTKPTLVATVNQFLDREPKGSCSYAYFSLIDPTATDMNFAVVGDHPYLYYVRFSDNGSSRVLFRQGITLTLK